MADAALLQAAGEEIDQDFENVHAARVRALSLRHLRGTIVH